jgi:hypothetical protein
VRELLAPPAGAQAQAAAAVAIGLDDMVPGLDQNATGRQIGPLDLLEQRLEGRVRLVEQPAQRSAKLGDVVRRDAGRHADGDAAGAVGQEVGQGRRQHHRLLVAAIIGRAEVDGVLVDAFEQRLGEGAEARLGVAHGRGVVAVDVAEVALAVDQRIALREILRQPHQGVVDRDLAVGVVLADYVADHASGLLVGAGRVEPQLEHGV